jgi:hypothetical protein
MNGRFVLAEVSQTGAAVEAVAAGHGPVEHNAVAGRDTRHAGADIDNDACTFMTHDQLARPNADAFEVRVADAAGFDLHEHFTRGRIANSMSSMRNFFLPSWTAARARMLLGVAHCLEQALGAVNHFDVLVLQRFGQFRPRARAHLRELRLRCLALVPVAVAKLLD